MLKTSRLALWMLVSKVSIRAVLDAAEWANSPCCRICSEKYELARKISAVRIGLFIYVHELFMLGSSLYAAGILLHINTFDRFSRTDSLYSTQNMSVDKSLS